MMGLHSANKTECEARRLMGVMATEGCQNRDGGGHFLIEFVVTGVAIGRSTIWHRGRQNRATLRPSLRAESRRCLGRGADITPAAGGRPKRSLRSCSGDGRYAARNGHRVLLELAIEMGRTIAIFPREAIFCAELQVV